MMYELRIVENKSIEFQLNQEVLGKFNDFPPGWEEISMEEFVEHSLGPFLPVYLDYRQMYFNKNKVPVEAVLYIQRDLRGFAIIPDRKDQTLSFYKFDGFEKIKKMFSNLPIKSDSGWVLDKASSNISRGIKDFNRTISFGRPLTNKEELLVKKYLLRNNCPGWTGIISSSQNNDYKFRTTFDSSD